MKRDSSTPPPIPMILNCAYCGTRHIDADEWATRPHRSHLCAHCGRIWRPANVDTVGVLKLE